MKKCNPVCGMDTDAVPSVCRNKMSSGVVTGGDPNSENLGYSDKAAPFSDADGVAEGLSQRTPMNHRAASRDSLGVNPKSRGKYDGAI